MQIGLHSRGFSLGNFEKDCILRPSWTLAVSWYTLPPFVEVDTLLLWRIWLQGYEKAAIIAHQSHHVRWTSLEGLHLQISWAWSCWHCRRLSSLRCGASCGLSNVSWATQNWMIYLGVIISRLFALGHSHKYCPLSFSFALRAAHNGEKYHLMGVSRDEFSFGWKNGVCEIIDRWFTKRYENDNILDNTISDSKA